MTPRAVVTGLGVTAPTGLGAAEHWKATLDGTCAIGPVDRFDASGYPARLAGEVSGFTPADHLHGRLLPQTDRTTQLALVASDWAIRDAGVDVGELDEFDMGVCTAHGTGGFEFGQRELEKLWSRGPEHVSAYQAFAWFYAVNTGQVSIRNGMRGPGTVVVSEQAGGLDTLGDARRQVRRGTGLVLCGSVDGSLCPWGWVTGMATGLMSDRTDPATAFRPFDADASGYVAGEGGALLVVEERRAAERRGVRVYGELAGHASTFDPRPRTGAEPGLRRAVELALDDARVPADAVDAVFADGMGVPELDRAELAALSAVFGGRRRPVPVAVPKTMTGRLCSGGPVLDVATALLSIRDQALPGAVNLCSVAGAPKVDIVVGEPREMRLGVVLVLARGIGGFNSAVVLRGPGDLARSVG